MNALAERVHCPDCGIELGSDGATAGLCPRCLMSLALVHSVLDPGEELDREAPTLAAAPGRILGDRYQMREMLGRGGMGEVWRAFDLKLRVDVALKSVRAERLENERARDLLRQEVRSAREVISPNVCRIFDLEVEDGRELVSMEYIDGTTLTETLRERGPLELQDAREIASQFLSGLEAIHQAGLVHRDFKPENVMLTRAGRVVVMDFGLAKGLTERGTGTVAGTPAYMAPEQSRGEAVDARADVYAAGVVLAEMLTVGGSSALSARRDLWKAVREEPPRVPEGPWARVLTQALDRRPEARPESARALARALEEVTLRLPGFEEERPYPGLASFTEEDAEYFHGREAEVEAVWKKLKRPRLLALIGPSGTGKSSFIRAGLLATLPSGWAAVVATPGDRPFQALARALVPFFAGDTGATEALLRFEDLDTAVSLLQGLREKHDHALVVVDQFEELFTQCPPETQEVFAELLGRLVLEADVHVLVSLRDDFLFQCHGHDALTPILNELTLLGPLSESALRRALVQPALACGYRFEDEALVEEMVAEVGRERGALPLLAFAASRLWDKRDRERGLLTRGACQEIGGVAGALAQHAEDTLERIGQPRIPLVREVFRNLVTAQGTRAARERTELLSVFEEKDRAAADEVLATLVDARLLTSFERAGEESDESHQEIEIIHESLLSRWPRLVRWQTQDADGAQLRDQLRQAAQAWQDRGQPEDLLWSGQAYRDLALWQERYSGGLSATEEAFARAASERASRQRRRRRIVMAGVLSFAAAVAIVMSVLWRQSESSRQKAEAEALRAEAGKLVALGEKEFDVYPTGALAYALRSLELTDNQEGRLLALRVLQRGPVARLALITDPQAGGAMGLAFSPDGEWLAFSGSRKSKLYNRAGGLGHFIVEFPTGRGLGLAFGPRGETLLVNNSGDLRWISVPDGRELRREQEDSGPGGLARSGAGAVSLTTSGTREIVRWWPFDQGESRLVGSMDPFRSGRVAAGLLAYFRDRSALVRSLDDWGAGPTRTGEHPEELRSVALGPGGRSLATLDVTGAVRVWPDLGRVTPSLTLQAVGATTLAFGPRGRWLSAGGRIDGRPAARVFDLEAPIGAEPLVVMRASQPPLFTAQAFDPSGRWLATAHGEDVAFWPLEERRPVILEGPTSRVTDIEFTPDGRSLLVASTDGSLRSRVFLPGNGEESGVLFRARAGTSTFTMDGSGRQVLVTGPRGTVAVVPLAGGPPRGLAGFSEKADIFWAQAISEDGDLVAAAASSAPLREKVIRVWNLVTGEAAVLGPVPGTGEGQKGGISGLRFIGRRRLLASVTQTGIVSFDLETDTGEGRVLAARPDHLNVLGRDGRFGYGSQGDSYERPSPRWLVRFDTETGEAENLPHHGTAVVAVALDKTGTLIATGAKDGTVRIGPVSGAEPHVFRGHESFVWTVAFSPDGRWLASAGDDRTIRLWPVPDVTRTPLHLRPHEELLAILRSHTNLRAVPDPESSGGYKLDKTGPFPGWAEVPEW